MKMAYHIKIFKTKTICQIIASFEDKEYRDDCIELLKEKYDYLVLEKLDL